MTIAQQQAQVHYIWQQSFQDELDTQLRRTLRQGALLGVKTTLEAALVEELNQELGFAAYERLPSGEKPPEQQRSGYFQRGLDTQYGRIDALRVPKLRRGNKDRPWTLLVRYQRAEQHLLDVALYLYVLGLSVRDLQEGLSLFMDQMLSRQAVNRITESVEAKVEAWRTAPLEETPTVLIVDGVWVKILYGTGQTWTDKSGHRRQEMRGQERVILVALALWDDGRYHVLHYEVAAEESPTTWTAFFEHLLARRGSSAAPCIKCGASSAIWATGICRRPTLRRAIGLSQGRPASSDARPFWARRTRSSRLRRGVRPRHVWRPSTRNGRPSSPRRCVTSTGASSGAWSSMILPPRCIG